MRATIRDKMTMGFGVIIVFMIISNAIVLIELRSVTEVAKSTLTTDARVVTIAEKMQEALGNEEQYTARFLATHDSAFVTVAGDNAAGFTDLLDSLSELSAERPILRRPVREIDLAHAWLLTNVAASPAAIMVADRTITLRSRSEAFTYIRVTLDQVVGFAKSTITASVAELEQKTGDSYAFALMLTGGTFLAAMLLAFWLTRTLTRPLYLLIKGTEEVARGSFAHINVSSNDEIALLASAFNAMSERLSQINAYKAEMMQHISHELRSPLQLIVSAYFVLTERNGSYLDEKQKALLLTIRKNIDKITRFADDFLDLSRMEAGQMEFQMASVDMGSLVRRAVDDATIIAAERSIRIESNIAKVPSIMADAEKCLQVVSNLLNNAVKYTNDGGRVAVTLDTNRSGVSIEIADTGIGIHPDELKSVFTKFFRAKNAVRERTKGTGLGLALVKAIVDGHGGSVDVKSELGKGSVFTVEFPFVPGNHSPGNGS